MAENKFDDLVLNAVENPGKNNIDHLVSILKLAGDLPQSEIDKFQMLWDVLQAGSLTPEIARLVTLFAARAAGEPGSVFRKLLCDSARLMLPRDMGHSPVMRALGARNDKLPVKEIAARMERLFALKSGQVLFLPASGRWGAVSTIDPVNGTVMLVAFRGTGSTLSTPLESILNDALIFAADNEMLQVIEPAAVPVSAVKFREIINRRAQLPVSEMQMRTIALSGCAKKLSDAAFNSWWNATCTTSAAAGTRRGCDGRNLQEMLLLLEKEVKPFADDEYRAFGEFFQRLKPETARRDAKNLAAILSVMVSRSDAEKMTACTTGLQGKVIFWPENPAAARLADLEVWGELPAKTITALGEATLAAKGDEYLAALLTRLPLKALTALTALIDPMELENSICEQHYCSADIICWIWKNRKKSGMAQLAAMVNIENVVRVMSVGEVPKAWGAALRELRTLLLDKEDFQKYIISLSEDNPGLFTATLCGALFLSPTERQSLLVKLSRVSPVLQECLEGGAAKQILNAGIGNKNNAVKAPAGNEPFFTSSKSHRQLISELEDIVNNQIPENREALKVARAHGDFRENSEFDAAKERRNHLSRRRSELERDLAMIQPVIMKDVEVSEYAVIGSEVDVAYSDGTSESFYLLGAWDGDPERKMLSYRTRLGGALLNRKVGESVKVGEKTVTIKAVRNIPAELAAELDD